jgi:hypothetical protein
MQVNYRPVPNAGMLAAAALPLLLICVPLWYLAHWGWPDGFFAGKMLVAPFAGTFWLGLLLLTVRRNRRLEADPLAFGWDAAGLRIKRGDNLFSFSWPEVGPVAIVRPKDGPPASAISMKVRDARTGLREFTFERNTLDLQGRALAEVVDEIEQARRGEPAPRTANRAGCAMPMAPDMSGSDRGAREERVARSVARGRVIGSLILVCYAIALTVLLASRSGAPATVLTPDGGLTYDICVGAGLIAFCGSFACLVIPPLRSAQEIASVATLFVRIVVVSLMNGAVLGAMAYPFAGAYSEFHRFSGPGVKREARQFPITEAYVYQKREDSFHVSIDAGAKTIAHPFGGATFDVGPADWSRMTQGETFVHHFNPSRVQGVAMCVTLPVEAKDGQLRALAAYGTPLPDGSVAPCR